MKNRNIEKNYNSLINMAILVEIVLIIFGLIMLFSPDFTNKITGTILGVILIFNGLSMIFNFIKRDGAKLFSLDLMFGILIIILGLVLVVYPYSVISFVTTVLGIFFLVSGASKINYGIWLNKGGESSWLIVIVNGSILLALGLLTIFNPFANLAVTQVIGIFLIISSLIKISNIMLFKNKSKDIMKIFW